MNSFLLLFILSVLIHLSYSSATDAENYLAEIMSAGGHGKPLVVPDSILHQHIDVLLRNLVRQDESEYPIVLPSKAIFCVYAYQAYSKNWILGRKKVITVINGKKINGISDFKGFFFNDTMTSTTDEKLKKKLPDFGKGAGFEFCQEIFGQQSTDLDLRAGLKSFDQVAMHAIVISKKSNMDLLIEGVPPQEPWVLFGIALSRSADVDAELTATQI